MNTSAAVLGPGAVGGSLAVRLTSAGVRVVCVAHAEAVGLIALAGLVVESSEGTLSARAWRWSSSSRGPSTFSSSP